MNIFKRARIRYILHRHAIEYGLWSEVTEKLAVLQGMTAVEKAHLRECQSALKSIHLTASNNVQLLCKVIPFLAPFSAV